ncbi:MAG: nucleotidyltransferase domain-containing protein [Thermodesulfobacteriota bacterium]|nr:nucleotidyltransferase domain-containing protein [Thermodesulfobacteriota bacterium]
MSWEMVKLEELGILRSNRNGKLKHFQANQECPFFEELKGLVLKTTGVAGRIWASLGKLDGIEYAFIYGSYAKGQEKADSDVDMDRLDSNLGKLESTLGREFHYVLYSMEEFKSKKRRKMDF